VLRLVDQAEIVGTSVVAYAEARAAFARRRRERSLTPNAHQRVKAAFEADWPRFMTLDVAEPLARRAGELAERHRLRGFDALHLASYLALQEDFPDDEVRFSAADRALEAAARRARAGRSRARR
jgi:hypothetical protein